MEIISRAEAMARGLRRYFTGALCLNGHSAERVTRTKQCVACRRANSKRWGARNPDKRRAACKRSYSRHAQRRRDAQECYRRENFTRVRAARMKYDEKNREKRRKYTLERSRKRTLALRALEALGVL